MGLEKIDKLKQKFTVKDEITRNFYDSEGKLAKQISNTDHGHKSEQGFGIHGEHAHDCIWNGNEVFHGEARELTYEERRENGDML